MRTRNAMCRAITEVVGLKTFFFKSYGAHYESTTEESILDKRSAVMVHAMSDASPMLTQSELQAELSQREITETILAFMATDPAYGGDCKHDPGPEEENEFREPYAVKAREWGCCPENQRVCRLIHMQAVFTRHWKETVL